MSWIRGIFSNLIFGSRRQVGKDLAGNKYYEEVGTHGTRTRRTVVLAEMSSRQASNLSPGLYRNENIPAQWRAWLSHTRKGPPSIEELKIDLERQRSVQEKARILEAQWQQRKQEIQNNEEYKRLARKVEAENKPREEKYPSSSNKS